MSVTVITVICLIFFLALILIGVPIGIGMGLVGFIGILIIRGEAALTTLATLPYSSMASWSLSVIPMFLLMGHIGVHAGFTRDAYNAAYKWLGRLPGGVAIATLFGGAAFGACCGSSIAATAALGRIAIPEMERFGYDTRLACGSVAMSGTLAALIPPSILLVLYGIIAEQSVGKLLIAGILPGLLSMIAFAFLVFIRAKLKPSIAPRGEKTSIRERLQGLRAIIPITIIFMIVIMGIYSGVFTPTEAGAFGAFTTMVLSVLTRRISWDSFKESVFETVRVSCSIFLIVLGAYIFIQFLAISRLPIQFSEWVAGLPFHRMVVYSGIILLYLVLGCFLDAIGLILLTVPFIFPTMVALKFDPIWFGVIVVKMVEIGLLTPPVGIQTYVLKGVAPHIPVERIIMGIIPFFLVDLFVVIGLLTAFPQIALFLPSKMK